MRFGLSMVGALALTACTDHSRTSVWDDAGGGLATDGEAADGQTSGASPGDPGGGTVGASEGDGDSHRDAGSADDAIFDVNGGDAPGGLGQGCEKVDFLFVVDNSSSMIAHQQALAASFPGFISAIEERIGSDDFHIMVVDTDTRADQSDGCGECHDRCVLGMTKHCGFSAPDQCEALSCSDISPEAPDACDYVLGAGVVDDRWQQDCALPADTRYIDGSQPDLFETFECIGMTGTHGTGQERPMGAMVDAVGMIGPGECNAGFVRDDAILVVTVLSDAIGQEAYEPAGPWYDALVAAKGGNAEAVVLLALLRNNPAVVPGPACMAGATTCGESFFGCDSNYDELVGMFDDRGFMHSICVADYEPFFSATLDAIALTCEDFEPEG